MKLSVSEQDIHISVAIVLSSMAVLCLVTAVSLFLSSYIMFGVIIGGITVFLSIISIVEIDNILSMSESDKEEEND